MRIRNLSTLGTALALATLVAGPGPVDAAPAGQEAVAAEAPEVVVVNGTPNPVEIYAFDSRGGAHKLAEVESGPRAVTLPSGLADDGNVYRLGLRAERTMPTGVGVSASPQPLVRTPDVEVDSDEVVKIVVAPDLEESRVVVVDD